MPNGFEGKAKKKNNNGNDSEDDDEENVWRYFISEIFNIMDLQVSSKMYLLCYVNILNIEINKLNLLIMMMIFEFKSLITALWVYLC